MKKEFFKSNYHFDRNYLDEPVKYGSVLLYQVGRMYASVDTVIHRHVQLDCIELTIVTDGCATVYTNGVATEVTKGDIYVSFAGDVHEIVSNPKDPVKFDFVAFNTLDPELHVSCEKIMLEFHNERQRVIRDDDIAEIVSRVSVEDSKRESFSEKLMEALINQMIIYMIRAFEGIVQAHSSRIPEDSEVFCYSLMNYIDSHIYTMRSLSELSEFTNYSYNYLSNFYKSVTGDTLMNYYRKKRLETARLLLSDEEMSVTKVSSLLGYSSVYTFSRAFKDYYGIAPSEV